MKSSLYTVQQIGFGPAGLGLFAAAERQGLFQDLLNAGIAVYEKNIEDTWKDKHLDYKIESNTPSSFFTEPFAGEIFNSAHMSHDAQSLFDEPTSRCELMCANGYLNNAANIIKSKLLTHSSCRFICPEVVHRVVIDSQGGVTLHTARNGSTTSRFLLLCTGSFEPVISASKNHLSSGEFLRNPYEHWIIDQLKEVPIVVIFGRSHSAYSVATAMTNIMSSYGIKGQIIIVSRQRAQIFFDSLPAAIAAGYLVSEEDAVSNEGILNLYNGLRGKAARTALQTYLKEHPYCITVPDATSEMIASAGLIISATGYQPLPLEIQLSNGNSIKLLRDRDRYCVDNYCRVLDINRNPLPNVFGLGIGFYRANGLVRCSSVKDFLGDAADTILREIKASMSEIAHEI